MRSTSVTSTGSSIDLDDMVKKMNRKPGRESHVTSGGFVPYAMYKKNSSSGVDKISTGSKQWISTHEVRLCNVNEVSSAK